MQAIKSTGIVLKTHLCLKGLSQNSDKVLTTIYDLTSFV